MAITLIVEDGTVVVDANSYVSLTQADAYFANRPDANWTAGTNDTKSTALIKATDYLVQRFRDKWKGYRIETAQTLDWPRQEVYPESYYNDLDYEIPDDVVPQEVKDCTFILAAKVLAGTTLSADVERLKKNVKVGPLEVEYFGHSFTRTQYVAVADRLKPLLLDTSVLMRA